MRRIFITLAKLLGLLQFCWGVSFLASVVMLIGHIPGDGNGGQIVVQFVGVLLYGVMAFGMAWLLLARTEWLADRLRIKAGDAPIVFSEAVVLQGGMKLVGLYFLTRAVPSLVRSVLQASSFGLWKGHSSSLWTTIVSTALQVVLALLLVIRTDWVNRVIARGEGTSGKRIFAGGVILLGLLFLLSLGIAEHPWANGFAGSSSSVMDTYYENADSQGGDAESRSDDPWLSLADQTNGTPTNALSHFTDSAADESTSTYEVELYVPL